MADNLEQNENIELDEPVVVIDFVADEDIAYAQMSQTDGQQFEMRQSYEQPPAEDNSKKKFTRPKNQRAISRQRRNKIIGRVLACLCVLVFLGIIAGTVAVTYKTASQLWWDNIGEEAGVEFKELFTLFNGVTDTNEKKIVTRGFSQDDLDVFYANLKRKVYLAQDYELSVSKIITSVMNSTSTGNTQNDNDIDYPTIGVDGYDLQYLYYDTNGDVTVSGGEPTREEIGEPTEGQNANKSLTGNEDLDKLLQEIKFDFSSLAEYNGEKNILEITDRQLGAVINDAFGALSGSFTQLQDLETAIGKSLSDVLAVKQVIISGNEFDSSQTKLKITLEIKLIDLLSKILSKNGLSILKLILPEKMYASATVYPYDAGKPIEISINRLKEEKFGKIIRIVDVILKKTGKTTSISDLLIQVNSKIVEVFNKAQEKLPITMVPSGSVDLYPIESLMGTLGVDVSEQAFLYMLRDIKLPTGESLGLIMPTPEQIEQETDVFVSELNSKYCLDNSVAHISNDNTIKDVMDFASSENALDAVLLNDKNNLGMYEKNYGQHLKVVASYKALAGMLSDYINNENLLKDIIADIVFMSYGSAKNLLSFDLRVNLAKMMGYGDSRVMSGLIKQLVPEYIYVSAKISLNADGAPTAIEINKTREDNSREHLQTLIALADKFGMDSSSLEYDSICSKIDGGLKNGLKQMQEKIGCDIIFTEDCAYLPNLFEVVCGTGLLNENEEHKIVPESLFSIMKQVYTYDLESSSVNRRENLNGFIGELEGKYYLQEGTIVDEGDGTVLKKVMGLANTYGKSIDQKALSKDNRAMSEIYPKMSEGEFAYLMKLNMNLDNLSDTLKSAEILGAKIGDGEIYLYLQAKLYDKTEVKPQSDLEEPGRESEEGAGENPEKTDADLSKRSNLLPETSFVTVTIDVAEMTAGGASCAKIRVDDMKDEQMSDFFSMIRKLSGKNTTASEIEARIGQQIADYMSDVKGIDYKFENSALIIDNIFNVIAKSDTVKATEEGDREFTSVEIRRLLKQLYGYEYRGGDFKVAPNLDNFINNELYNKYFISEMFRERLLEYASQDALFDGFKEIGGNDFSVNKIRLEDRIIDGATVYGLKSRRNITYVDGKSQKEIDEEIIEKFRPIFSKEEIAYLLRDHVSAAGEMSFMKEQEIVFATNDENVMTLTVRSKGNLEDENAMGMMPEFFFINVTIELGQILADGTRSDMNVHAMDINSVRYAENAGEEQDLQLLLMLIERMQRNTRSEGEEPKEETSLEGIMNKIETKLNVGSEDERSFKENIHNNVFTVTFLPDGGFVFNETVYQVSLNSVYGAKANEAPTADIPDELNFRNGLCKVNNMPDKYEYTQGVFLDFKDGNRSESSQRALDEINFKYALATPLQGDTATVLTVLGNYAKDYATSIDGQKLTDEDRRSKTYQQLRPSIGGEELIWLLEDSVTFKSDGYKDAVMNALYILGDKMAIVYKSPVDKNNEQYAQLLPSEMSIVVGIDLKAIDRSDVICTEISINDLIDTEVNAVQAMLMKVNEKDGADGERTDLIKANEDCSQSVRKTMSELTGNINVAYQAGETVDEATGGGAMILDSIYEIATDKINVREQGEKTFTAIELKGTLEALFNRLNEDEYDLPDDLSDGSAVNYTMTKSQANESNLLLTADVAAKQMQISGAIGDWNVASILDTGKILESLKLGKNAAALQYTILVPKSSKDVDGGFNSIRDKLQLSGNSENFLITLDMNMTDAAGEEMSILPKRADLTVIYELLSEKISIVYNAMTKDQCDILSKLIKANSDGSGIDLSNTDDVKEQVYDMTVIDVHEYGFELTLGQLLEECKEVIPIVNVTGKNTGVVLGKGVMTADYGMQM